VQISGENVKNCGENKLHHFNPGCHITGVTSMCYTITSNVI
jgi:hypothetical protein